MRRSEQIRSAVAMLDGLAPAGHFLAVRLRGASPLLTFSTFPVAWTDAYMENGYMMRDPVTTWALTIGGAIRWSSPFLFDPFGIFREAAKHGLKFGASIAHGPVRSLSLCSLARSDRELTDDEIAEAQRIVIAVHGMSELPEALDPSERALLLAVGTTLDPTGSPTGTEAPRAGPGLPADEAEARMAALCDRLLVDTPDQALRRARDLKLV